MADQRIDKWTRWVDGTIRNNVLTMHLHRETWREVAEILGGNGQLPDSYWWEFMRDMYATTQAIAVRRQAADTHKDVASLGKLIEEVRNDPSLVTRDFWLGLWDTSDAVDAHFAEHAWADQYGGSVGDHLDPGIPAADFEELIAAASDANLPATTRRATARVAPPR